ncbi:peptidylprolyl isomerase [Phytoactinopolyspora alkaliphila]|uniref:Peptidylprolyl isomerase n=1 Tax=Phytoactinopolyspora alkaliphila TaxID=1783498 RepID=A0A6N9YGV6_9ACTN|nr:SurA N-terminal domain-containing protein [Phytoactinopolyspora alkaliphila]NED94194.1 peptidylprolyl isomerase [Phytoactinopolyspora alkaliphila]
MPKKLLLSAGVVLSLLGVAACGEDDEAGDATAPESAPTAEDEGTGQEAAPEPDLEGIPDVVAVVNGEEISRDEFVTTYESQFQQMAMQAQMSGEEVDQEQLKAQTADSMVDSELLVQEADDRGFDASQDDVDTTLNELAEQNGLGTADDFLAALAEQGMPEEEVMKQLELQVKVDQLISDEAGDIEPSEDELRKLYDDAVAQQEAAGEEGAAEAGTEEGAEVPSFEEVRPQLEEQAISQKEAEVAQALLADLRESGDITVNL